MPPRWPQLWGRAPAAFRPIAPRAALSVGPNSVEDAPRLSALRLLLRQFESPLVLILVFAAAISLALQQWVDAAIILAIVLGSTLLGFFQEYRASTAVEELKKPPGADVPCGAGRRRADGAREHDRARRPHPALGRQSDPGRWPRDRGGGLPRQRSEHDGRVLSGREAARDRSRRTRLSRPGPMPSFSAPRCKAARRRSLPSRTGRRTEFGAIAARLRARQPETDFARGVRQFGYLLIRVMVVIVLFVLTVNLLARPPGDRVPAVRRGARGRPVAGALAGDHQRDPFRRRPGHEQARRHRPPPRRHREPRQHGHPVHRQDRHADRGHHRSAATSSTPEAGLRTRSDGLPFSMRPSRPASKTRSMPRSWPRARAPG